MTDLCPKGAVERFTNNKSPVRVLLDEDDAHIFDDHNWSMSPRYVRGWVKGQLVSIHRLILNAPHGSTVDHINGDSSDNRKTNLRICSLAQNMKNRKPNSVGKSLYKGVVVLANGRFRAKIDSDGKRYELGVYENEHDAAIAYNAGAKVLHGEFARLNEIPAWNTRATGWHPIASIPDELKEGKKKVDIWAYDSRYADCIWSESHGAWCHNQEGAVIHLRNVATHYMIPTAPEEPKP